MAKDNNGELIDPVSTEPVVSKPSSKSSGKKKKKRNIFKSIAKWFREMKSELKKVVWPSARQTLVMSGVALLFMAVAAVVIWGFDELAQFIVKALISIGK